MQKLYSTKRQQAKRSDSHHGTEILSIWSHVIWKCF